MVRGEEDNHEHEGLVVPAQPYYALYSFKIFGSDRFDLLGNSLAILTGIASPNRARNLVAWVEAEYDDMRESGDLAVDLPVLFVSVYLAPSCRLAAAIRGSNWSSRGTKTKRSGVSMSGLRCRPAGRLGATGKPGRPPCTSALLSVCGSRATRSLTRCAQAIRAERGSRVLEPPVTETFGETNCTKTEPVGDRDES